MSTFRDWINDPERTPAEVAFAEQQLWLRALRRRCEAHQRPPKGDWWMWLLLAGRWSGKSWAAARYIVDHVHGPSCFGPDEGVNGGHRMLVVAPTLGDAVESCAKGPSAVTAIDPTCRMVSGVGGTFLRWESGAEAKLLGAHTPDDVERFRGSGNRCLAWLEELASWVQLGPVLDQLPLAVRSGPAPRVIATTTPKPRGELRRLIDCADRVAAGDAPANRLEHVGMTRATTADNPHAPEHIKAALFHAYEGKRLGRQELYGELLEDYEGALWHRDWIEQGRVRDLPPLVRGAVGVDPSTWDPELNDQPGSIGRGLETGIVSAAIDENHHVYVVEDASMRGTQAEWAKAAIACYRRLEELCPVVMVPETNIGPASFSTIRQLDPDIRFFRTGKTVGVRASSNTGGKRARAEPVSALYEPPRIRAHHVGVLPALEGQLCGWDPAESWSPDRLDAMVYAITALAPWVTQHTGQSHSEAVTRLGSLPSRAEVFAMGRRR